MSERAGDDLFNISLTIEDEHFYRRELPANQIALSSQEGRRLFHEALARGTMENFFPLMEQFTTQVEPAFCGISSLVMVLNALRIDPGRVWKGPWRWFDERLADACNELDEMKRSGVSMEDLLTLARCNGIHVEAFYYSDSSLMEFRKHVASVAQIPDGRHLVASYQRTALGQTGAGHFSPIGGYHERTDRALILDVARFKYPPHWTPVQTIWNAMQEVDDATGRTRGYFLCEAGAHRCSGEVCS